MNFTFHQFFKQIDTPHNFTYSGAWGMALALHDRLISLGQQAYLVVDHSLDIPVQVCLGNHLYSYNGKVSRNRLGPNAVQVMPGDLLGHSQRVGVYLLQLDHDRWTATLLIDKAIQMAVEDLSRQGGKSITHNSFEGSLLRAHRQGFDITNILYHETEAKNESAIITQGFDLKKVGSRINDSTVPDGVFLKPTPKRINVAKEPIQMAFIVKEGETKVFNDREALCDFLKEDPIYFSILSDINDADDLYTDIIASFDREIEKYESNTPERKAIKCQIKDTYRDWHDYESITAAKARERATQIFKEQGINLVKIQQDLGSYERMTETLIVIDPAHVKSIQHDFMPIPRQQKDKANEHDISP